tara:strand:+ start:3678 stop:4256 length:579 start_codon:yes stop_codon:yes gene_type:complete
MTVINNFKISDDSSQIDVMITAATGETVTKILVWDYITFQNYSLAVDLTTKLAGTSEVETFIITAADMGINSFTGLFFMEVSSSDQTCEQCGLIAVAANLTAYNECLLNKIIQFNVCAVGPDCNDTSAIEVINLLLRGISICLQNGYYMEAIDLLKSLDKLCGLCETCKVLAIYCSNSGLTFATLNNTLILI